MTTRPRLRALFAAASAAAFISACGGGGGSSSPPPTTPPPSTSATPQLKMTVTATTDFPGTFGVAGGLVQFRVPWSALGGDPTGSVFAFLDWSAKGDLVGESTTDNVPNRGTAPFG